MIGADAGLGTGMPIADALAILMTEHRFFLCDWLMTGWARPVAGAFGQVVSTTDFERPRSVIAMTVPSPVRLFIGSSSEGRDVARNLQAELQGACDVQRWDQDVFEPGGYALDSLLSVAARVDFAVLVASPDDTTISRGVETPSIRDNVILEFGLLAGVLGRQRVYLLATGDPKLPTDVLGLTRLPYHPQADGNHRAAVTAAVLQIEERIRTLGRLDRGSGSGSTSPLSAALEQELALVCANAIAQGWTVKTNNVTTLRLRSPRGTSHTLAKTQPDTTRAELRRFAAELKAGGLRVNQSVRRPVTESPF